MRTTTNFDQDFSDSDDKKVNEVLRKTLLQGGSTTYAKGDKI